MHAHRNTEDLLFKMVQRSFQKDNRYRIGQSSRRRYNRCNMFRWLLNICLENLPERKWDQVVMFLFLCSLFPFFHALLGIGGEVEQHANRPAKATGEPPNNSQGNDTGKAALFRNQLLASDANPGYPVENSEHIAHLTRAPIALAPQDAFPDPTSPITHSDVASSVPSTSAFAQTPEPRAPVWFQGDKWDDMPGPYDPFHLEFNGMPWSTSTKAI
ncbi:uncharacterized protein F5891DRAFT_1002981 [Suillus fuscotomentosus]|uniref:Uncharacterized protein n=1 Tax=Suillus fuscotomentosus TaxID=1912939 RepID=A0AAD4HS67_9AGAM|nr:uncharacterized protein F5891DRAFT_1002981 [Suillus fuscotomentosus]KAG1906611.1 hypothetical protein F5891DRAFT_1002981 [Suillus fuscotomentosus]